MRKYAKDEEALKKLEK